MEKGSGEGGVLKKLSTAPNEEVLLVSKYSEVGSENIFNNETTHPVYLKAVIPTIFHPRSLYKVATVQANTALPAALVCASISSYFSFLSTLVCADE